MFKRIRSRLLLMVGLIVALGAGAPSVSADSGSHGPGVYDDQSGHLQYNGRWTHVSGYSTSLFYNGTTSYSNDNDASVHLGFTGTGILYCSDKGPSKGPVIVTINTWWGSFPYEYNYYAPTRVPNVCQVISVYATGLDSLDIDNGDSGLYFAVDYIDVFQ